MYSVRQLISFLLCLSLLSGCSWSKRRSHPVSHVTRARVQGKRDLACKVRLLTGEEVARTLFGVDLTDQGYQVLRLRFENHGPERYSLRPSYCAVQRASVRDVSRFMEYDTSTRCLWLSVPALLLMWEAIPLAVVPLGLYWSSENQRIREWLDASILGPDDVLRIRSYETIEKYMIIMPGAPWREFDIKFCDLDTKELVTYSVSFSYE